MGNLLILNTEIKLVLRNKNIPIKDGLAYLLCLYYEVEPSYIPEELERRVLSAGIVSKNYESNTFIWKISLFEETIVGFEWISEWMDLFKKVNPERRGTKADVLRRMKKFFINNPAIRKDDVFKATNAYLASLSAAKYCMKSHKFIYEQDNTSMLLNFVESSKGHEDAKTYFNRDMI